jgi:hypothetical protein
MKKALGGLDMSKFIVDFRVQTYWNEIDQELGFRRTYLILEPPNKE